MSNNMGPINTENPNEQYGGPRSGDTPAADADLHDSGLNPYNQSSPEVNGTDDTGRGFRVGSNAPLGYYTNPATSGSGNPYGQGVDYTSGEQSLASDMASGLDALYNDVRDSRQPTPTAPDPGASGIYNDEGYGPTGTGRS
jgi:hypothetical protein